MGKLKDLSSILKILKYNDYQTGEQISEQTSEQTVEQIDLQTVKQTSEQTTTNKKDNKVNKDNKEKKNFIAKSFFQKLFTEDEEIKKYSSLKDLFIEFLEYKTAIKKQYKTENSVRNAFLDFVRLSKNDENYARALVTNTIARGWQSIYDLSAEQKKSFRNTTSQSENVIDWESRGI